MNGGRRGFGRFAAPALAAAMAAGAPARAEMTVERWTTGPGSPHPRTVRVLDAGGGASVIRVDLRELPKGRRVYGARLFAAGATTTGTSAETPRKVLVYPLTAAFEPGKPPTPAGRPLAPAPPAWDALDATRRVAAAAGGSCELLVKSLPAWDGATAALEVVYEGRPLVVPPQAGGLQVVHRAGQTFITWREIDPLLTGKDAENVTWGAIRKALADRPGAARYRIYAHTRPITAESLPAAKLLGEVGPLSGYNVNGRSVEYVIGRAMVEADEIGELSRGHNGLIDTWHMDHPRLHRCPIRRFVVPAAPTGKDGKGDAEDRKDRPPPTAALPPGTGLYVHSPHAPGERYYAVVACRAGAANTTDFSAANALSRPVAETVGVGEPVRQGEGLWGPYFDYPGRRQVYVQWAAPPLAPKPNMYFNWSVLVPPDAKPAGKLPVELYFHRSNRSYAKPRRKHILDSVQIAGHDYPFSGWYGFNEAFGTLKDPADGVVRAHTLKRVASFLAWAEAHLPVDPNRVIAVGADGAAQMALACPELFAYVLISDFEGGVLEASAAGRYAAAWGPRTKDIADEQGRTGWGWAMLDKVILAADGDLPLMVCKGYCWGRYVKRHGRGNGPVYDAMHRVRQPLIADWTWASGRLVAPDKHTGLWRGLDLTRATPVPAFADSSLDVDSEGNGQTNLAYWWKDVTDTPDAFGITVINHARDATVDLTPRRLQRFRIRPGGRVRWQTENRPLHRGAKALPPAGGVLAADKQGLVTLKKLKIPGRTALAVKLTRAK